MPLAVEDSVLNTNFRIETTNGSFFLRIHRPGCDLPRLEREASAMQWCARQGIPVALPVLDRAGRRFVHTGGRMASLYEWVDGRHIERGAMGITGASVLGDIEGRLQAAMATFPPDELSTSSMGVTWDTAASIERLNRIADALEQASISAAERELARDHLRFQLELLTTEGLARADSDFDHLQRQPVFGDFHERNVIVDEPGTQVLAVVDWELICLLPPLYELLRAVQFAQLPDDELRAWVRAYAVHQRSTPDICRDAVELRWQESLHGAWALATVILDGDPRPRRFLKATFENLVRWSDSAYRDWLTAQLIELCCD
jgi:Ser/Thr protein kinase RdoA (MazF antagonist)